MNATPKARPGRNDPCTCGSGRKFKVCCGKADSGGQGVADGLLRLAAASADSGRPDEALAYLQRALEQEPTHRAAGLAMARAQLAQGLHDAAIDRLRALHAADPAEPDVGVLLAQELTERWQSEEALAVIEPVLAAHAGHVGALCAHGSAAIARGRVVEGLSSLERAALLAPRHAGVLNNLANARMEAGDALGAVEMFRRSVALAPKDAGLHGNLAATLLTLGRADEAIGVYAHRMTLAPHDLRAFSELLFAMHYGETIAPEQLALAHRRFGELAQALCPAFPQRPAAVDTGRRLRLGIVSSDLRRSSVAWFLWPLLDHIDRGRWELHAYHAHPRDDEITARLKPKFEHWCDIAKLGDAAVAQRIADDRIDLLLDLNGHTDGNRLPVFARRPAPVQLTWLGYPNTTGLPGVDFRLTDAQADPPGQTDALHSEALLRLEDCFLCFRPPKDSPTTGPAVVDRPFTFGTFNQRQKIGPAVVALWSRLLLAVPGSRLVLKTRGAEDRGSAAALVSQFAAHGVAADRLVVLGRLAGAESHLARYHDLDLALDTFPYAGTTTTCDALWMGVPVVTLAGPSHVSRVGVSLLRAVGLDELVAADADAYLRIAAALAADRPRLTALREGLRERIAASPLMDGPGFARRFEAALLSAWARRQPGAAAGGPTAA